MAWKQISIEELARSLKVNPAEVREKQNLIRLIVDTRKRERISQAKLAKMLGITQGRVAQIESGVGTAKVTFDILLNILVVLGYDFRIVSHKRAA